MEQIVRFIKSTLPIRAWGGQEITPINKVKKEIEAETAPIVVKDH